jgi:hypothetical protein
MRKAGERIPKQLKGKQPFDFSIFAKEDDGGDPNLESSPPPPRFFFR